MKKAQGFTLIELLVVIAIIGVLSSVVLSSLATARAKALDVKRAQDVSAIRTSLELYHISNGAYPNSGGSWRSQCVAWGGLAATDVIPGLAPTYMSTFPSDPQMDAGNSLCCYLYQSNGTDYKFLGHNCPSMNYNSVRTFIDPARDGGSNSCLVDGTGIWSWAVYSSQSACSW